MRTWNTSVVSGHAHQQVYRPQPFRSETCTQLSLVHTEINFLCRLSDRPTIEESFSSMPAHKAEKSITLAKVNKEKENKNENQNEVVVFICHSQIKREKTVFTRQKPF